jgi:CubicO group peptidase (beta-lactamase class C family)
MQAQGRCDPAFRRVGDAFVENFAAHDEVGASACVIVDGRVVVDLWGGWADVARTQPWQADTLVNVYSVGKGLTGLIAARLVGLGSLDVTAPVTRYWPEFAADGTLGKEATTVAHLLSHQAGLPAIRHRLPPDAMYDHDLMARALAAEAPWWEPGKEHGYHVNTFGFLVGEVIRRVTGKSVGTLLRHDVAGPLDADVHIGLPAPEHGRVAQLIQPEAPPPSDEEPGGLSDEELMTYNAHFNPSGLSGVGVVNTPAWRMAEVPGTNAHASARGVARVYAALAAGGRLDGLEIVDPGALAAATTEQVYGVDRILRAPTRYGLGFQLTHPERPFGPNPRSFGHHGAGGSLGFCDPDAGVAFAYVMNRTERGWRNPRNRALVDAVYASLG